MLIAILILALILRIINLGQSIWLDEGINAVYVNELNFKQLFFEYPIGDFHPPLFHLVLKTFITFFQLSEWSLRVPSVIFGVMTVITTYLIGKRLYDNKTGVISALLIATSPLAIYYSQEARMYSLAAFLASLSVYFFVSVLKNDKVYNWIGFILATALTLYTEYIPYLLIPTFLLFITLFKKRIAKSTLKSFLPSFLLVLILISPWLLVLPNQLKTGLLSASASPVWASVVGSAQLKELPLTLVKFIIGRISIDNNLTYLLAVTPLTIFYLFLLTISLLRMNYQRLFLWFYLLIPATLAFIISINIPVYSYFRLVFILPAFYILAASAITNVNWTKPTRFLLIIALMINITCTSIYLFNSKFHRENWRDATNYVIQNSDRNTIVLFESNFTMSPFDYYNQDKVQTIGALNNFNPKKEDVLLNIQNGVQDKSRVYLFQYLSSISDPQGFVFQSLVDLNFANTNTVDFRGVGFVYEFIRR